MDANGIVTVYNAQGTLAGDADYTQAESPQVSLSSLIRVALDKCADAVQVVIDLVNRKVWITPHAGVNLESTVVAGSGTKIKTFTPDAEQEGRSLAWTAAAPGAGFPAGVEAAVDPLPDAVAPRRTLASMVNAIISGIDTAEVANADLPIVVVSQTAKTVTLAKPTSTSARTGDMESVIEEAGAANAIEVSLGEPSDGEGTPLPFEGGAV